MVTMMFTFKMVVVSSKISQRHLNSCEAQYGDTRHITAQTKKALEINANTPLMFALCFLDYTVLVPPEGADMNGASPPLQPARV